MNLNYRSCHISIPRKRRGNHKQTYTVFDSLNCLNLSMQGAGFAVIDHAAKVVAYYKKLIVWKSYVARDECDMFPELTQYICGKEVDIKQTIIGHLKQLGQKFVDYYGDPLCHTNEND